MQEKHCPAPFRSSGCKSPKKKQKAGCTCSACPSRWLHTTDITVTLTQQHLEFINKKNSKKLHDAAVFIEREEGGHEPAFTWWTWTPSGRTGTWAPLRPPRSYTPRSLESQRGRTLASMQIWPDGSDQYSASETVNTTQRDGVKYGLILATRVHDSIQHGKTDHLNVRRKYPTETAFFYCYKVKMHQIWINYI